MPPTSDPTRDPAPTPPSTQVHEPAAFSFALLGGWIAQSVRRAGWLPIAIFSLHAIASLGWNAYRRVPNMDNPMHNLGGVAIAYFFWHSLQTSAGRQLLGKPTIFALQLLTINATGATTGLWEFAEWTTDSIGWTHAQGGVDDTMLDMFLGMFGGSIFVIWIGIPKRHRGKD